MQIREMTSRKLQAFQTRQKIVDTALQLFGKKGYEAVTVDDICDEAGVSKGAFYHHFPSKDQILLEKFMSIDSFYRQLEKDIAMEKSCVDKLRRVSVEAMGEISDFGIDILTVAYASQLRTDKKTSELASNNRHIYKLIGSLLKEGQERGEFRKDIDIKKRTRTIVSSYRGLVVEWCLKNGGFDLVEAGRDLADNLLEGILER
jgi:AcrR family transcriptional regulator